jgi:peptidoglycan hydrolase CwlO-like protein
MPDNLTRVASRPALLVFIEQMKKDQAIDKEALELFETGKLQMGELDERGRSIDVTDQAIEKIKARIAERDKVLAEYAPYAP